jgi:hypothetical protein
MKYERVTLEYQFDCSRCEDRQCTKDGFCCDETFCKTYNRLAELEDKIERGELVDVKENHLIPISRGSGKSSKQLETIEILTKYENGTLVEKKTCVWEEWEDGNFSSVWCCSNCKEDFCFIEGDVKDNMYKFCPNCGAEIVKLKELEE